MRISSLRGRAARFVVLGLTLPSIALASPAAWVFERPGATDLDALAARTHFVKRGLAGGLPDVRVPWRAGRDGWVSRWRPWRSPSKQVITLEEIDLLPPLSELGNAHRRAAFAMLLDEQQRLLTTRAYEVIARLLFEVVLRSARPGRLASSSLARAGDQGFDASSGVEPIAVPEPGSGVLVGLGLGLLAARASRRRGDMPAS